MKIAINVTTPKYRHCWQWISLSSFLMVLPQASAPLNTLLRWLEADTASPHMAPLSTVSHGHQGEDLHCFYTASTSFCGELRFPCYIRGELRECLQHLGYVAHLSPLGRNLCRIQQRGTERRQVPSECWLSEPCISWHIGKHLVKFTAGAPTAQSHLNLQLPREWDAIR